MCKFEKLEEDFRFLSKEESIGIYNKCEVIEIYGITSSHVFNILTVLRYTTDNIKEQSGYITKKPMTFKGMRNIKWGIKRRWLDKNNCENIFKKLLQNNKLTFEDSTSKIGRLELIRKKYVSCYKDDLNNILQKSNENGNYVMEAFDISKKDVKFLLENQIALNEFSDDVNQLVGFDIMKIPDRLGNVIFQFPINKVEFNIDNDNDNFYIEINLNKDLNKENTPDLHIIIYEEESGYIKVKNIEKHITIPLSEFYHIKIKIVDLNKNIILWENNFSPFKIEMMPSYKVIKQNRIFELDGRKEKVILDKWINSKISQNMVYWINDRRYDKELKLLEEQKSFVQYKGINGNEALKDIRYLLNRYGQYGVYLWDKFLSAKDIKNTLYYTPYIDVPLKAITGLENTIGDNKKDRIDSIKVELDKDNKEDLHINLEVRAKKGNNGWDFHDRFLIFPLPKPKVWSLGISVNQLGRSYHILQEIKHAKYVLGSFNELWNCLNNEDCIVWKLK